MNLLIDAIAGYRLTRLITADVITERPRAAVIRWAYGNDAPAIEATSPSDSWTDRVNDDPAPPALARLITCPWCTGVWVAAGITAARRLTPRLWAPVAETAVVAAAAGLLASWEG